MCWHCWWEEKYGKSNTKKKEFIIIGENDEFFAAKDKNKGDIIFLGSLDVAEDCWDALFDSNKEEFKDWKKNRYHLVTN